jgi:hypothetical protein
MHAVPVERSRRVVAARDAAVEVVLPWTSAANRQNVVPRLSPDLRGDSTISIQGLLQERVVVTPNLVALFQTARPGVRVQGEDRRRAPRRN